MATSTTRAATGCRRGLLLVIAGPSGCGKTTIVDFLLEKDAILQRAVNTTTRPPRPGEVDGVHYDFRTPEQFDYLVSSGGMLEHAMVFGRQYGTRRAPVEAALARGVDVVSVIDWQGHRTMRDVLPGDVLGVFLQPPSVAALEARIRRRGDTAEQIALRIADAQIAASHAGEFDHVVINDTLPLAMDAIRNILAAARARRG